MRSLRSRATNNGRRGFLAPLMAFALLTVMASAALVLDRLWLETAVVELQACAEAAAFAAGHELACDELLRGDGAPYGRIARARKAAAEIALRNRVAGRPVILDPQPRGDVRFGKLVRDPRTQQTLFLEAEHCPLSVVVTAHRTRTRNNPIALLFRTASGNTGGDAVARAEVSLDNRIVGLQPIDGVPVPALPLAILRGTAAGGSASTWHSCIEQRLGSDRFAVLPDSDIVVEGIDGLPELTLEFALYGDDQEANVQFVDLGPGGETDALIRQVHQGLTQRDLDQVGGTLLIHPNAPGLAAVPQISRDVIEALRQTLGSPRICLLYEKSSAEKQTGASCISCAGLVAARLLAIREKTDGRCELTVQPTVLTTRTACLAADSQSESVAPNPYIYKLHLTQ